MIMPSSFTNERYKYQSSLNSRSNSSGSGTTDIATPDSSDVSAVSVNESLAQLQLDSQSRSELDATVQAKCRTGWQVKGSSLSLNTHNRIRNVVESLNIQPNPQKPMIPLSIGKCEGKIRYCFVINQLHFNLVSNPAK